MKETFKTDGEYWSTSYCRYKLANAKNPSELFLTIKDMLLAYELSTNLAVDFITATSINLTKQISMLRNSYEKNWLMLMLDSVNVNKNMDRLNYYVGHSLNHFL